MQQRGREAEKGGVVNYGDKRVNRLPTDMVAVVGICEMKNRR